MEIKQGHVNSHYPVLWFPDTLEKAYILKQQFLNDSCIIAGGPLLQTYWEKGYVPS
ncbi:hypothetical protein [Bacillus sp. AFS055030]|uniref:hypothetical protein n=1 Tax=Bacillus sp. AFS055030 TaxID=2033507 RepID=UPI0015D4EE7A|nr:hypothetical protein [Bacillus sp. AFS055030]